MRRRHLPSRLRRLRRTKTPEETEHNLNSQPVYRSREDRKRAEEASSATAAEAASRGAHAVEDAKTEKEGLRRAYEKQVRVGVVGAGEESDTRIVVRSRVNVSPRASMPQVEPLRDECVSTLAI